MARRSIGRTVVVLAVIVRIALALSATVIRRAGVIVIAGAVGRIGRVVGRIVIAIAGTGWPAAAAPIPPPAGGESRSPPDSSSWGSGRRSYASSTLTPSNASASGGRVKPASRMSAWVTSCEASCQRSGSPSRSCWRNSIQRRPRTFRPSYRSRTGRGPHHGSRADTSTMGRSRVAASTASISAALASRSGWGPAGSGVEKGRRRFGGVASLDAESTWGRYRKHGCDRAKAGNAAANPTNPGARSSSAGPNV